MNPINNIIWIFFKVRDVGPRFNSLWFFFSKCVKLVQNFTHFENKFKPKNISHCPRWYEGSQGEAIVKKNSSLEAGNYRPVSIVIVVSKILEKKENSVFTQLVQF